MIKRLVKNVFKAIGYDIVKRKKCMRNYKVVETNAQINMLDVMVSLELLRSRDFNFLQVGANDGKQSDPLNEIINKHNISGILLEPVPATFERLKANYLEKDDVIREKVILENLALIPEGDSGDMPFYQFADFAEDDKYNLSGYSTTDKKKLVDIRNSLKIDNAIVEIKVKYESVTYFLNKRNLTNISLLVLDAEGMDIPILLSFLNDKNHPKIIYMEILDQPCAIIMQLVNRLIEVGYRIGGDQSDLIAYRES
jgi:FkbM family methyltransferase